MGNITYSNVDTMNATEIITRFRVNTANRLFVETLCWVTRNVTATFTITVEQTTETDSWTIAAIADRTVNISTGNANVSGARILRIA